MEPAARQQIEAQRGRVESLAAGPATAAAELGAAVGELGRLYHAYGLEEAAAGCYLEAERLDPEGPNWPYYLGFLHQVRGDPEEAAAALERALTKRPDDPAALVRLARARSELGESGRAAELFRRVVDRHPAHAAAAHAGLAEIAAAAGRHREAAEHYAAALRLQPTATRLHYPLALAYRELGDEARAAAELPLRGDAAVGFPDPLAAELDSQATGAALHVNRAGIALAEGRHEEAVAEYRLALATDPDNATARYDLGMLLAAGGDLAGARGELEEARRLEPANPAHHEALARVLAAGGDEVAALSLFRRAVELDPERAEGHLQLAAALARSGAYLEAERAYGRALELDPGALPARLGRAEVLLELELPQGAASELERVLTGDPENARARLRLAEARQRLGETELALRLFEEALAGLLELDERVAALVGAANLSLRHGKLTTAVDRYRQALELAPGLTGPALNLAAALAILGREPEAIATYDRLLVREPDNRPARLGRAELRIRQGAAERALAELAPMLERDPDDFEARLVTAAALERLGRRDEARGRLEEALAARPESTVAANALVRLLATGPGPAPADAGRALELALALMAAEKSPLHAETLAMALAAAGRFAEAVDWQRELVSQAESAGAAPPVLARLRANLERYESGSRCCAEPGSG